MSVFRPTDPDVLPYKSVRHFGVRYSRYGSTWELRCWHLLSIGRDWEGQYAPVLRWEIYIWLGKTRIVITR